jgi:hypothetical protein
MSPGLKAVVIEALSASGEERWLQDRGNVAFLLRSESGRLFRVDRRNAQEALSATPLRLTLSTDSPFRALDLFETESGGLEVRGETGPSSIPFANGGKRTQR